MIRLSTSLHESRTFVALWRTLPRWRALQGKVSVGTFNLVRVEKKRSCLVTLFGSSDTETAMGSIKRRGISISLGINRESPLTLTVLKENRKEMQTADTTQSVSPPFFTRCWNFEKANWSFRLNGRTDLCALRCEELDSWEIEYSTGLFKRILQNLSKREILGCVNLLADYFTLEIKLI